MEAAVQRETQPKRWTPAKNEALIVTDKSRLHLLARRRG
jgi:predicted GIY-YIG superfamily endonuclease